MQKKPKQFCHHLCSQTFLPTLFQKNKPKKLQVSCLCCNFFQFPFSSCHNDVPVIWFGLGTKNTCFVLKYLLCHHKHSLVTPTPSFKCQHATCDAYKKLWSAETLTANILSWRPGYPDPFAGHLSPTCSREAKPIDFELYF